MNAIMESAAVENDKSFVLSHLFNAPRARVWEAWTGRDHVTKWFGPAGATISRAELDFRPGGRFHFCLRMPNRTEIWGRFIYREILAPQKLVWVHSFSDAAGGVARHPLNATWPLELLTTLTLAAEGNKTKLTLQWHPLYATPQERATFDAGHDSMRQGWAGTFGQLTGYLARRD
jgi:uncharacterized protein YndB with AHSA1/START domain